MAFSLVLLLLVIGLVGMVGLFGAGYLTNRSGRSRERGDR